MTSTMKGLDPVVRLLAGLLVFFTLVLIVTDWFFKSEGQVFQVFSNALSGIVGALLMRVKPDSPAPPGTHTVSASVTETSAEPPKPSVGV